jgi:hypothetical protein
LQPTSRTSSRGRLAVSRGGIAHTERRSISRVNSLLSNALGTTAFRRVRKSATGRDQPLRRMTPSGHNRSSDRTPHPSSAVPLARSSRPGTRTGQMLTPGITRHGISLNCPVRLQKDRRLVERLLRQHTALGQAEKLRAHAIVCVWLCGQIHGRFGLRRTTGSSGRSAARPVLRRVMSR